jgi:uncharacterized membrane protein YgcG
MRKFALVSLGLALALPFVLPLVRSRYRLCPPLSQQLSVNVLLLRVGENRSSARPVELTSSLSSPLSLLWRSGLAAESQLMRALRSEQQQHQTSVGQEERWAAAYDADGNALHCATDVIGDDSLVYLATEGTRWQWAPERTGHVREVRIRWPFGEAATAGSPGGAARTAAAEDDARRLLVLEGPPGTREEAWELAARADAKLATNAKLASSNMPPIAPSSLPASQPSPAPPPHERLVTLETLSSSPPIFRAHGLVPDELLDALLAFATPEFEPSTVGDASSSGAAVLGNRIRDDRRTSHSAWLHGFNDPRKTLPVARAVQRAAADLLRLTPRQAALLRSIEPLLCVRYAEGEFYEPHHDFFAGGPSSTDASNPEYAPPTGTNRFATLIIYLAEPEAGGHTVFPFATRGAEDDSEGGPGGEVTDGGEVGEGGGGGAGGSGGGSAGGSAGGSGSPPVTPGAATAGGLPGGVAFVGDRGAPSCDFPNLKQRRGLMVAPRRGDALLFYDQTPDGALDGRTRHGACPVVGRTPKVAANVWAWNREAVYR